MSGWGDHNDEMPGPAAFDDATVEALLSGRPVDAGELGPLAAFAEDVRFAVDGPAPAPTAEMARLLAEGIPTPTGVTRAALAPQGGARHADVSKRRKTMTITELLAALMAKLAGLGAASKAALGLGVAAASVTGAGAAGVLPDAAQHAAAEVVGAATPFELEDPRDAVADAGEDAGDLVDEPVDGATNGDGGGGDDQPANHGGCVSEAAHNAPRGPGGEHGRAVSAIARSDCGKTATTSSPSTTTTVASPTTTTTIDDDQTTLDANRGRGGPGHGGGNPNHGNSGPGNSGNGSSGNGNSGPGNSGNGGGHGHGRSGR